MKAKAQTTIHRTRYNPNKTEKMKSEWYCTKCDTVHDTEVKPSDPREAEMTCKNCNKK